MNSEPIQSTMSPEDRRHAIVSAVAPRTFWKRQPVIVLGTILLAGLSFLALHYLAENFTHESTDDAFLAGKVVAVAPRISGQVTKACVNDNQPVKTGDLLVEIDPRDFEIEAAQKKAALNSAEANTRLLASSIHMLDSQVATAEAEAKQSEAEAAADKANADKAEADFKRAEDLFQKKIVSQQEFDAAKAAAESARSTMQAGQQKSASSLSKVAGARAQLEAGRRAWERAEAQSEQSKVDVEQADLNLTYTKILTPQAGRVTRKAVQAGDYIQVGQKLMALVPEDLWVVANFKETQLKKIHPGLPVKIAVDSLDGQRFAGHVDSIQAGSGAAFSLLPPENAVGNYVKVVQRVPVKIVFEKPVEAGHVLGPGMSVVPFVKVTDFEVPEFVLAVLAVIVAFIIGFFWWRAAGRPAKA